MDNNIELFLTDKEIKDKEKAIKKENKIREQELDSYSNLLNNEIGIKFLKELYIRSGSQESSLLLAQNNNSTDIYKMAYIDGMKQMFSETIKLLGNDLLIKVIKTNDR